MATPILVCNCSMYIFVDLFLSALSRGATFAIGMTKDSVDFVRPGAPGPTIRRFLAITRALYNDVVSDKHEDLMARFGTALGRGFIDAGGRNVTIMWRVETQVRSSVW
jgi:26S proteasome regulatory subunit N2